MLLPNEIKAGQTYKGRDGAYRKVLEVAGGSVRYQPENEFVLLPVISETTGFAMWAVTELR